MKYTSIIIAAVLCINYQVLSVNALECPKQPEQSRKDWDTEVNLAVARIGSVKGAELTTKVTNATRDLLSKLPNADKLYLEQMMYAAYCSALRDDKTIPEREKAKRLREYNDEVRKVLLGPPNNKKKAADKPTIHYSTTISSHEYNDLVTLAGNLGIDNFDLSLDDSILYKYYLVNLRLENSGKELAHPLNFEISTGSIDGKILDIRYKVNRPFGKIIRLEHSIPNAKWVWPASGTSLIVCWDHPEGTGFNIYRSLLLNRGYGRINPKPIISTCGEVIEKSRVELYPAYYKLAGINSTGDENELSCPFEVQNRAPIKSFIKLKDSQNKMIKPLSHDATERALDDMELDFSRGKIKITFLNGLDANADIDIYLLCKILPGSNLTPSLLLEGAPTVQFSLKGKAASLSAPKVRFEPDQLREALTPIEVEFYSSPDSIYFEWKKPNIADIAGIRIFRTSERLLGDLHELRNEDEIYHGVGLTKPIVLVIPEIEKGFQFRPTTRSEGSLRSSTPTFYNNFISTNTTNSSYKVINTKPSAVNNFHFHTTVKLESDYYIDKPPESRKIFTYIFYGFDKDGNMSYPVFVNASLADPNEGVHIDE